LSHRRAGTRLGRRPARGSRGRPHRSGRPRPSGADRLPAGTRGLAHAGQPVGHTEPRECPDQRSTDEQDSLHDWKRTMMKKRTRAAVLLTAGTLAVGLAACTTPADDAADVLGA